MNEAKAEDKTAAPAITVCVVAYRSGATLAHCVERLAAQSFTDFELVLVDNASPQGEAQPVAAAWPFARLIENPQNLGFAAAMNQAARAGRGRWLALLNPDAFPDADWLARLADAADRHPSVRAFACRQLMDEDPTRLDGLGDVMGGPGIPYRGGYRRQDPGNTPEGLVFSACGGAMLIDRALFLAQGGFDERFFCYCEDVDLGYRLQLIGEPTLLVPAAVVRHVGSASSGGPRSDFAVFHGVRNRFWVLIKDTPWPLLPLVLVLHVLAQTVISLVQPENRRQIGLTLKAYAAALKGLGPILAERRKVQAARKVSAWRIARLMTWNPLDLAGRRAVIRPPAPTPPAAP